jgi:hypothetical protein
MDVSRISGGGDCVSSVRMPIQMFSLYFLRCTGKEFVNDRYSSFIFIIRTGYPLF